MTRSEALQRARALFGHQTTVDIDPAVLQPRKRYVHPSGEWCTFRSGAGRTWDEALNQAERKHLVRIGVRSA